MTEEKATVLTRRVATVSLPDEADVRAARTARTKMALLSDEGIKSGGHEDPQTVPCTSRHSLGVREANTQNRKDRQTSHRQRLQYRLAAPGGRNGRKAGKAERGKQERPNSDQ